MKLAFSPLVSEFSTTEESSSYDNWFFAKMQASLDDTRPGIPHDEVMAEIDAIIDAAEKKAGGIAS